MISNYYHHSYLFTYAIYTFCIVSTLSFYPVQAQLINTTHEDAVAIQKRILLVALPQEDKYLVSEYQDNQEFLKRYREDLEGQKTALKTTVLKYWHFSDSMVILPFKEAKALMKKQPNQYAMLHYAEQSEDATFIKPDGYTPATAWSMTNGQYQYNITRRQGYRMIKVTSLVIDLPKRVLEVFLPKASPSEGDFIYAIYQMNYVLSNILQSTERTAKMLYKEIPLHAHELKSKTLMIDVREVEGDDGLTSLADIQKYYPYPVIATTYEEIEKVLKSGDTKYILLVQSRYDYHNSTYYLSNAGDGTIYCNFTGSTFAYGKIDGTLYTIQVHYPGINRALLQRYAQGR